MRNRILFFLASVLCAAWIHGCDGDTPAQDGGSASEAGTEDSGSLDSAVMQGDSTTPPNDRCEGVDCSGMDTACTTGQCNSESGTCENVPRANGTSCDDEDMCTTSDVCMSGTCGGTAVDCSGVGDACNPGSCDPTNGMCVTTPIADGAACDDINLCTTGDICSSGTCAGTPVNCDSAGDMCNVGICDTSSGSCTTMPRMDGTSCNDMNLCTLDDICTSGVCAGTLRNCMGSSDICNTGVCDESTGSCIAMPVTDGTTCDDTDACTEPDVCTGGSCGGTTIVAPGDTCTSPVSIPERDGIQTFTGSTRCANGGEAGGCGGSGAPNVVYELTLTSPRTVRLDTNGSAFDTVLYLRSTCAVTSSEIECDDDDGTGLASAIEQTLDAGTYYVFIDGIGTVTNGAYTLNVTTAPFRSCLDIHKTFPSSPSGSYRIQPDTTTASGVDVYCDMTTDGGGWTLVGSTRNTTLNDEGATHYSDLSTLTPTAGHTSLWNGMRTLISGNSDIRFSCRNGRTSGAMTVDLAFYNSNWYRTISTGSDAMSCFMENDGAGYSRERPPEARRNLLATSNGLLPYGTGREACGVTYLEGENSCGDTTSFTVDFDGSGMGGSCGSTRNSTAWGEQSGTAFCGSSSVSSGQWFVWVREEVTTPRFLGYASWTQNCTSQNNAAQDTAMQTACNAAFPGSHAATTDELVTGRIGGLPTTNTSGAYVLGRCPSCEGATTMTSTCTDGSYRLCLDPGRRWFSSLSTWQTAAGLNFCGFSVTNGRRAVCLTYDPAP